MRLLIGVLLVASASFGQIAQCGPQPPRPANIPYDSVAVCTCMGRSCFYQWQVPDTTPGTQGPVVDSSIPLKVQQPRIISPAEAAGRLSEIQQIQIQNEILLEQLRTLRNGPGTLPSTPSQTVPAIDSDLGLRWEADEKDDLCIGIEIAFACSTATLKKLPTTQVDQATRFSGIYIGASLYPRRNVGDKAEDIVARRDNATTALFLVVVETDSGLVHVYRRAVPIRVSEDGGIVFRFASMDVSMMNQEATRVISLDINELSRSGEVLTRHIFR